MARINPFQFIQQTRAEITKVVWPTRREVLITTAMVLLLAIIAALFFQDRCCDSSWFALCFGFV